MSISDVSNEPLSGDAPQDTSLFVKEVFGAINNLSSEMREVLLLVYVEGFKYREAAEILDIPVGTVMSRLAAARRTLKSQLDDDGEIVKSLFDEALQ